MQISSAVAFLSILEKRRRDSTLDLRVHGFPLSRYFFLRTRVKNALNKIEAFHTSPLFKARTHVKISAQQRKSTITQK